MKYLGYIWRQVTELRRMPRVSVNLMYPATENNEPFYAHVVKDYYTDALRRHPRFFFVPRMVYGVALCELPPTFDEYYMLIEASARRNHKKAGREGCVVRRIQFNDHLDAIGEIRQSAKVRQGRLMPADYRSGVVPPCQDPPSRNPLHDFAYFGVFSKDKLIGYAGCLIAGEICVLEHILGHAEYLTVGAVPLLIIGVASHLYEHHPHVRYYAYGTYFGAGETMQRFKRKFGFLPYRVDWRLGDESHDPEGLREALPRETTLT